MYSPTVGNITIECMEVLFWFEKLFSLPALQQTVRTISWPGETSTGSRIFLDGQVIIEKQS